MRLLTKRWSLTLALALGSATFLHADPQSTEPKEVSPLSLGGKTSAKISVADMSLQSSIAQSHVKDDSRHVIHLRELARKQKDVIKLTCVNDKLVQMKPQENMFDSFHDQLAGALASDNADRYALYTEVTRAAENVHKLRGEAETCLGEPEISAEHGPPDVTAPVISDDPTKFGNVFDPGVEPPAYASPWR